MPDNSSSVEIRSAREWSDYLQCEQVQSAVWQLPNDRDIVPAHLLKTAHENGGLLLGAFVDDRMVAFVFGFLGSEGSGPKRRVKHCSHMLAVLTEYRSLGLGLRLKLKQREELIDSGLELATWTFDPLQAINARLNIARLGGISRTYLREVYGEMQDGLNSGVASDRLKVEWWVSSRHVEERLKRAEREMIEPSAPRVYETDFDSHGQLRILAEEELKGQIYLLDIPLEYGEMRKHNLELARQWRRRTRDTLERAFSAGYVIVDVTRYLDRVGGGRAAYLLQKSPLLEI